MALTAKIYEDSTSDGSPLVLCDSGDNLDQLRFNGQQLVDPRQGVRSATAKPVARGNITSRVSFTVKYAPETSPAAAEIAMGALAAAIVAAAQAKNFFVIDRDGDALELSDAAIESYELDQFGVTVIGRFVILGGLLEDNPA